MISAKLGNHPRIKIRVNESNREKNKKSASANESILDDVRLVTQAPKRKPHIWEKWNGI